MTDETPENPDEVLETPKELPADFCVPVGMTWEEAVAAQTPSEPEPQKAAPKTPRSKE